MKKLAFLLVLVFSISITNVFAAPGDTIWTRTYGGDQAEQCRSIQQTSDGGYIMTGWTESFGAGYEDVYLVKTDASGDTVWTRTFGNDNSYGDRGSSVDQTNDGGYVVVGYTYNYGVGHELYLIKTDANGGQVWERTYGINETFGYSVQQTTDVGYIITGEIDGDIYLVKTDANGDTLWTKNFGGWKGNCVRQTSDGGFIIAANVHGSAGYLIKTDTDGDSVWVRTLDQTLNSVQQTDDGGFILASDEGYLIKTNPGGYQIWSKYYNYAKLYSAGQTFDGGYIATGNNNATTFVVKTDAAGDSLWTRLFDLGYSQYLGYSIQQTADANYIVAGYGDPNIYPHSFDIIALKIKGANPHFPEITDIVRNPQEPRPGQPCQVSATITDTSATTSITTAELRFEIGAGYETLSMNNVADSFFATIPGQPGGSTVDYYIYAEDDYGDSAVSDTFSYFINVGPVISNITRTPFNPSPDDSVNICARITDPVLTASIAEAKLFFKPGGGYQSVDMDSVSGSNYCAAIQPYPAGTVVDYFILAVDDLGDSTFSDTLSYYVSVQVSLECTVENYTPLVHNEGGYLDWSLTVTNWSDDPVSVHSEIYPTIGDCASGNQITGMDIHKEVIASLPGNTTHTAYYYYYTPTVQGINMAGLTVAIGPVHDQYVTECCFEFHFAYPYGNMSGDPSWNGTGLWVERGDNTNIPVETSLGQNYPNPFNATTVIPVELSKSGNVSLKVYNLAGQLVETLVDGYMNAGSHEINWDASAVSSGVYFYTLETDDYSTTKKMNLLK